MVSTPANLRLALLLLGLSLGPLPAQAASEMYCCNEASSGRRVCGDSLPAICRGKPYRVYDKSGNLRREVGPPLTPEQKEAAQQEALLRKKQEAAEREQRRLDQALLATYASADDIERAQEKSASDIRMSMRMAEEKIAAARKQQQKLTAEAEFYRKGAPPEIDRKLRQVTHEIQIQQDFIDMKTRDLANLQLKFDKERQRFYELTGRSATPGKAADSAGSAPASPTTSSPASPSAGR